MQRHPHIWHGRIDAATVEQLVALASGARQVARDQLTVEIGVMARRDRVLNWITGAELAAMRAHGWVEVERHVADDDGRTVVRLRHRTERHETFRSLADVDDAHEQLTLLP